MLREKPSPSGPSPYEAFTAPSASSAPVDSGPFAEHLPVLKMFRRQRLALGISWILFGPLGVVAEVFVAACLGVLDDGNAGRAAALRYVLGYVMLPVTAVWMFAGVGTLMKRMEAVWIGLVVSYLSLLGSSLEVKIVMIVLTILVIVQAHRVLGFASKLRAAGVPLDSKA